MLSPVHPSTTLGAATGGAATGGGGPEELEAHLRVGGTGAAIPEGQLCCLQLQR